MSQTAAGYQVSMRYDALGRLTRRMVPERVYGRACDQMLLVSDCEPFPRFPNDGDGYYRVPEEWHYYRYDAAGNQVYAENADARVRRTYFPNGSVQTDSTWIRPLQGETWAAYGLRYTYDLAGRVTALQHPANLTGSSVRPDSFYYHPVTGALSRGVSRLGHGFDFYNAPNGQLTSIRLPGAITDSMRYDMEGRLVWRHESGAAGLVLHDEAMQYDARGKLLRATNGGSVFQNWYTGLGSLAGNDWYNLGNAGRIAEELRTDPLGSTGLRRTSVGADANMGEYPQFRNVYHPGTGRLMGMLKLPPAVSGGSQIFEPDSTWQWYDGGGNVTRTFRREHKYSDTYGGVVPAHEVETRSYYGADDRLRVFQKMDVTRDEYSNHTDAGVWEEYRYDPLGRRVMVRTRTDAGLCNSDPWPCTPSTTLFVWAGDQLLWELKSASGAAGGNVSYFHAGGIDRPLVITKGSTSIIPHQNWRGQFARGTYADGTKSDCLPGQTTGCTPIPWPGEQTTARHERESSGEIRNWFGGLVDGMRDASGQMYMRNRYYDPQTGQFTQTDPIGLPGGLNAYGFGNGDPVSYSDPYGLCADNQFRKHGILGGLGIGRTTCPGGLSRDQYRAVESAAGFLSSEAGGRIVGMLESGDIRRVRGTGNGQHAGAVWRGRDRIVVTDGFFGTNKGYATDGERGWVLGHELGHLVQAETGGLLYEPTLHPISMYLDSTEKSPLRPIVQRDANKYACNHTAAGQRGDREGHCTP